MSSKIEDFPTPVSPTRRIVISFFFDVLMIPSLRDSTSLESMVRTNASRIFSQIYLRIWGLSSSSELQTLRYSAGAFPLGQGEMLFRGSEEMFSLEERSKSVGIDDSDFCGNTGLA